MRVLLAPVTVAACQEPRETADAFWTGYCIALAALYRDDAGTAELLQAAQAGLQPAYLRIADPLLVEQTCTPVLRVALCLARRDAPAYATAMSDALAQRAEYYGRGDGRGERLGLLAFELAGLRALAQRLRIGEPIASDQLPEALFQAPGARSTLTYHFPPLRLLHDGEAHWFLDLQAFPRTTREHQLLDQDGMLIAMYRASGVPCLPSSEARFALADDGEPGRVHDWPLALDAGQLLYLHDLLLKLARSAAAASDLEAGNRYEGEAAAIRDALALRLPELANDFDVSSLRSTLGRQVHQKSPEWFGMHHLRELASPTPGADVEDMEVASQTRVMVSIAWLAQQLTPLLQALAQDRDGILTAQLRPRPEDYAKAFQPVVSHAARAAFEALWNTAPHARTVEPSCQVQLHLAPAGMLAEDNALSHHFPSGYRAIAQLLDPHRVWAAWKLTAPGKNAGMAYDGLVWLDDHWAWFPKPYRVLAAYLKPSDA